MDTTDVMSFTFLMKLSAKDCASSLSGMLNAYYENCMKFIVIDKYNVYIDGSRAVSRVSRKCLYFA